MLSSEEFKQLIHTEDWAFTFRQRNEHRLLMADLWARALYTTHGRALNLPSDPQDSLFLADSTSYMKKTQRRQVLEVVRQAARKDDTHLRYVADTTQRRAEAFAEYADGLTRRVATAPMVDRRELAKAWQAFDTKILQLIPWFYIPWYITEENLVTELVRDGLERHRQEVERMTDLGRALLVLITPVRRMMFQDERRDFFALVSAAQTRPDFKTTPDFHRQADSYLARWAWMTTFVFLPLDPLSFDGLTRRVQEAIEQEALKEYEQQERRRRERGSLAERLIRVLANDSGLLSDIELARTFGWVLTWSVETALKAAAGLRPFYELVATAVGVTFSDFSHLRSGEILAGIVGDLHVTAGELARRREGYVHLYEGGQAHIYIGSGARGITAWLEQAVAAVDEKVDTFSGLSASPGVVRGRVLIAPFPRDASALTAGDVLVCPMTSPDYVSVMQRAGAIVTDEGGLLSHAAIVSRELGKPCVVGTKIATKVLKDGDEVEVDANKGIVKILKRVAER